MLKVVTLNGRTHDTFPEPDGEIITVIEQNTRHDTITLLTRVDESSLEDAAEAAAPVESPPIDPGDLSVSDLRSALADDDYDWNAAALRGLLQAEKDGEARSTAIDSIEEALERQ